MFKFKYRKAVKNNEGDEKVEKKSLSRPFFIVFITYLVIFFVCYSCYLAFISTYTLSVVEGRSMQPTINPNTTAQEQKDDIVYVNRKKTPEKGDVVIVSFKERTLIKRLIATEGEWVSIFKWTDGYYHVAHQEVGSSDVNVLYEDYILSYEQWTNERYSKLSNGIEYEASFYGKFIEDGNYNVKTIELAVGEVTFIQVPDDHYFYLGDNRGISADSRSNGTTNKKDVIGVGEIIVHDGNKLSGIWKFTAKLKAIFSHFWSETVSFFAR